MGLVSLHSHRAPVEKLGAYALDHLDDDERAELQAHLDDCPACRVELEQIAPVVTLLPKVDPDRLAEPLAEPPPHLAERVFESVERERWREARRTTPGLGWIAAAAIILVVFALPTFFLLKEPGEQVTCARSPSGRYYRWRSETWKPPRRSRRRITAPRSN